MAVRQISITTALADSELMLVDMQGHEELGRPFHYQLKLYSPDEELDANKLLGKTATVTLIMDDGEERFFNGCVAQFSQSGRSEGGYAVYQAVLRPWLWLLTLTWDCKIFQHLSVPDIICQIFDETSFCDYELQLNQNYPVLEYCVQYRESSFNFVSRLMEKEGIYYYFTHQLGKHKLVLIDAVTSHPKLVGDSQLVYHMTGTDQAPGLQSVTNWELNSQMQAGTYTLTDYDFIKPKNELMTNRVIERDHTESNNKRYDYPGGYSDTDQGGRYAQNRIEEEQVTHQQIRAQTNARNLSTGGVFGLESHPREDQNIEYLVISANYQLYNNEYTSSSDSGREEYSCHFSAISSETAFRTASTSHKTIVQGSQTAVVVGPAGEEIYPDKYGRIKVQFHWDRIGSNDENSSCWVRVQQIWAGPQWGAQFIPRIGHEVIVEFLEGDPDKPIITGRVYNDANMPTYSLPDNKTQSGIKSRSSSGGSAGNFNEIRLEDKKGSEELYFQAEKDQNILVKNNKTEHVGVDETVSIGNNQKLDVGNDQTSTIGNDQSENVGNNRTESVGAVESLSVGSDRQRNVGGNESITVEGSRSHTIKKSEAINVLLAQNIVIGGLQGIEIGAKQSTKIGMSQDINVGGKQNVEIGADHLLTIGDNQTKKVVKNQSLSIGESRVSNIAKDDNLTVGKNLVIEAGDSITIKCGKSQISMKKDGTVVIKGKDISIDGSGKINAKASKNIVMKGKKILQN